MPALSTRDIVGLAGAILLFVGVFLPIVSMPLVGGINYFQSGRGGGTIVVVFAVLSVVVLLLKKYGALWFTGAGALGMLAFTYSTFYVRIAAMRSSLQRDLQGDPFAGLDELAMQIQWGWAVLVVGALLVVAAAAWEPESAQSSIGKKLAAVALVTAVAAGVGYALASFAYALVW